MQMIAIIFTTILALPLFLTPAQAYFSTMDTGEILPTDHYRILSELQYVGDPSGLNLVGGFDAGVSQSSNIRVLAGVGSVSFQTGLFYKWIPFPDYGDQPAIGLMVGGVWARYHSENYPSLRVHPLVSKSFETDYGKLTPYASLPFGVTSGPTKNTYPLQLTLGGEWKPIDIESWRFMAEVGMNLNESFNYISVGATYFFDDKK
jgi:hypothetical protein